MSNRRRRRELHEYRLVNGSVVDALSAGLNYQCPDCDSIVVPIAIYSGQLARVEIQHDTTCPWLRARTA